MHQIELKAEWAPPFLEEYQKGSSCDDCAKWASCPNKAKGTRPWGCWRPREKVHLNQQLALRQKPQDHDSCLCAYCEQRIKLAETNSFHIDHIIQRSQDSTLCFSWVNLVLSCGGDNQEISCGRYKDNSKLTTIHPIMENGRHYINFTLGFQQVKAIPAQHLTDEEKQKGQDSITALNLNHSPLCTKRYNALNSIRKRLKILLQLKLNKAPQYAQIKQHLMKELENRAFCSSLLLYAENYLSRPDKDS